MLHVTERVKRKTSGSPLVVVSYMYIASGMEYMYMYHTVAVQCFIILEIFNRGRSSFKVGVA